MSETIFSKIIKREIPATIVYEDEYTLAFNDINPVAPVHILVIPKKPIDRLSQVTEDDTMLLGRLLLSASKIANDSDLTDYRVVINNGAGAGQSVFHLHLHVIGNRPLSWPPG